MTTGMKVLPMTEGATEETSQDILVAVTALQSDLNTLAGIDYATEATATGIAADLVTLNATATGIAADVTKLREWPYTTWDKQALTEGATTDTWTYTSGVTSVGTITITYTDATKGTIQDVVYSPAKAV